MAHTLHSLWKMKSEQQKIAMLTCYDASFAQLMDNSGVDVLLVGDSLGMVVQGEASTLPVTLEQMVYHTRAVVRGTQKAFVLADLPFGSYQQSPAQAFASASALMAAGAHMVKLEGGAYMVDTVRFLVERGIPVCGHLGLTPQSVNQLGGYKVQGRNEESAQQIVADAQALAGAGVGMIVLELLPSALAKTVTDSVHIPTIGIGAGVDCDGQVLVCYDMLGIYPGKKPRFVKNFLEDAADIPAAITAFVDAVRAKTYPGIEHGF